MYIICQFNQLVMSSYYNRYKDENYVILSLKTTNYV